jgi:hypothetical protein
MPPTAEPPEALPVPRPLWIEVEGFKALRQPARLELRPLTVIAGANSGGKSSIMQPLLLLKQTLEASFDPGPLLLDGPHAQFTLMSQLLSRGRRKDDVAPRFGITFGPCDDRSFRDEIGGEWPHPNLPVRLSFGPQSTKSVQAFAPPAAQVEIALDGQWHQVSPEMGIELVAAIIATAAPTLGEQVLRTADRWRLDDPPVRHRIAGGVWLRPRDPAAQRVEGGLLMWSFLPLQHYGEFLRSILHLPGLRGHRDRRYATSHLSIEDGLFVSQGPFTPYAASLLAQWQDQRDPRLQQVHEGLRALGLSAKVVAKRVNAAELELKVARLPVLQQGGANDLVDIADVGFGVSQVLPILVALAAAAPGQLVYVEQPELHLHPRAQRALGRLLAEAAARGVCVVAETHSRLVLRAIQTALADSTLKPEQVGLHWFSRDPESGFATVRLAELDEKGAFGDWPVDFSEVEAEADDAWLDLALGGA